MGIQRQDKFGNPQEAVPCYDKGRGWFKGFIEIGGKLYQLEVNPDARGEGSRGDSRVWITVTRKNRRQQAQGGGRRGGGL